MKRSAGILLYKKENNQPMVLLAHFGGPYWQNKEKVDGLYKKGL